VSILSLLLMGWITGIVIMTLLWFVQRRTGNAGIVDVGWAATIALLAVSYAAQADGFQLRRILVAVMGGLWGLRLALHIHHRSHGRPEDGRYQQLRREWAPRVQSRMFRFYQFQALAAAIFSLPYAIPAVNAAPRLHILEIIGAAIWALALIGETTADLQLETWRKNPANKGRTCRAGLWNLSRHPNYFFESLIWCGVALFCLASPHGYWAIICPACIFYLLFKVTGIPATEEQAVRSRGEDYRQYQREVNAFVPWFPKKRIP
jgi:steroid 5-alpha reductase family enzyme